ncbi:MAG: HAMP domain-containing histidine kinase [Deltaproteobacteria bacterium]|nr:HAMP domain-containing histidine kinase [Deltaproteobacteria bacterium]
MTSLVEPVESKPQSSSWLPGAALPAPLSPNVSGRDEGLRARLVWLTRLRWVAILGQLAVVWPALSLGWLDRPLLVCFLSIVGGLALLNIVTSRWVVRDRNPGVDMLLVQLLFDLAALTSLLLLSGGAWNPLAPLLFVHAALGALLLDGWRSAAKLAAMAVSIASVTLAPLAPPALPVFPTPVNVALPSFLLVALVIWGFTSWLTSTLGEHRRLLLNLKEHQERGDRLRAAGALAAGFSHEFSTPLNTLKMRLDRLSRGVLGEEDPDLVAAQKAADHCESVLRKMIGRRLEPGELRMENVDVHKLVERVCSSWAAGGRQPRLTARGPRHRMVLPALALTQALLNLLDNASEAMLGAGDTTSPVEVELDADDTRVRIAVLDRGPGWPQVVLENLGQPFVTTKIDGTGLGLYNAHALAVALGGRLRLEERAEGGAIATFLLPVEAFAPGELQ